MHVQLKMVYPGFATAAALVPHGHPWNAAPVSMRHPVARVPFAGVSKSLVKGKFTFGLVLKSHLVKLSFQE